MTDFRVVAIISAFNEADIIGQVLAHLIEQRIAVYLIDDGSSDGTAEIGESYVDRGVIALERRPHGERFQWAELLRRKEALSTELPADWLMHHDADELRESPWFELDLLDAIREVDQAGFNAIDFRVFNFRPTDESFVAGQDPRTAFSHYETPADWDHLQVKAWRNGPHPIDLVSSGGHEAIFPGRRVCPLPFILRHYPIRSPVHGRRKVFLERKSRFDPAELAHDWHVQYAEFGQDATFLWPVSALTQYDPHIIRRELAVTGRHDAELNRALRDVHEYQVKTGRLEGELSDLRGELQAGLKALDAERNALQAERNAREHDAQAFAVKLGEARDRLESALRAARDERQAGSRAAAELQAEIGRARGELHALLSSYSWRMAAPLRIVAGLIGIRAAAGSSAPVPGSSASPQISLGDLARQTPISGRWGLDRGEPIDRYYIRRYLESHRADVRGRVLEVKDSGYTNAVGGTAVTAADVIDVNGANTRANLIADLTAADRLPGHQFDCFILTQTLHIIYDCRSALRHAARLLKKDGVLLCTIPAVSRISDEDGGLESGDYWRMTAAAVRRLFAEVFAPADVDVQSYGNVLTCTAFLYGLAAEELSDDDLAYHDPWFPLLHCVRAVKRD